MYCINRVFFLPAKDKYYLFELFYRFYGMNCLDLKFQPFLGATWKIRILKSISPCSKLFYICFPFSIIVPCPKRSKFRKYSFIRKKIFVCTRFLYKQRFFQLSFSVAWRFHESSFKCCLAVVYTLLDTYNHHYTISIIILRHILYLIYYCPCLHLCLFELHLRDLFFIFSLIFIVINHMTSFK